MTTPFGRSGGKSKIANQIISYFPNDYKLYVEPFFGAGNIFFRLPEDKQTNPMIINDLDEDIFIVLKGLQKNSKYINDNINRDLTKNEFEKIKNKRDPISIIEKIKNSYMANGNNYTKKHILTDYVKIGQKLQNTIISNEPFQKIIKKYDNKDTFFYLDPPYENTEKAMYNGLLVEPLDVYNAVKKLKGRFILSYNNSDNIRFIFKDFYIYYIDTSYNNQLKKTELIISNFSLL
jgi:DNA adenine methylase